MSWNSPKLFFLISWAALALFLAIITLGAEICYNKGQLRSKVSFYFITNNKNHMPEEVNTISQTIIDSMDELWSAIILKVPTIGGALLVLVLGLIFSPILGNFAKRLVKLTKVDSLAEQAGLIEQAKNAGINLSISGLIGGLVKWFFLIVFFVAAVDILGWERLTDVLYSLLFFIPNVIVAVIILTVGLILANWAERLVVKKIEISKTPIAHGKLMGKFARWAIIIFSLMTALFQLGIAQQLIVILFAGMILTFSLAFGLGGRQKAAEIIERLDGSKQ